MSDFILGEHEALIKRLVRGQDVMQRDISEIKGLLAERRGERRGEGKATAKIAGLTAAFVSIGLKVVTWLAAHGAHT